MIKKYAFLSVFGSLAALPMVAFAETATPSTWLTTILSKILTMVLWPIFLAVVVGMFIYIGILYLIAHGDAAKIKEANKAVIWAMVGIIVAIVAFSIVGLISNIIVPPSSGGGGLTCTPSCVPPATCSSKTGTCVSP